ncbi:hypothetical protein VNO77_23423 [Canavalia gladiata]|uniref:Uncharacterized protein n=1 Tax=Canavalia gladiata TaxID=3824 RepID=A0AAN9QFC3_CANGL
MMEKNKKQKHEAPPPELATKFKNRIAELNGPVIKFIMYKTLFISNLKRNNNHLSMSLSKFMYKFITEVDKENLEEREGAKGRPQGDSSLSKALGFGGKTLREYAIEKKGRPFLIPGEEILEDKEKDWGTRRLEVLCWGSWLRSSHERLPPELGSLIKKDGKHSKKD